MVPARAGVLDCSFLCLSPGEVRDPEFRFQAASVAYRTYLDRANGLSLSTRLRPVGQGANPVVCH
jgi:hypothetical protein